jgi:hypothetical protein
MILCSPLLSSQSKISSNCWSQNNSKNGQTYHNHDLLLHNKTDRHAVLVTRVISHNLIITQKATWPHRICTELPLYSVLEPCSRYHLGFQSLCTLNEHFSTYWSCHLQEKQSENKCHNIQVSQARLLLCVMISITMVVAQAIQCWSERCGRKHSWPI